MKQTLQLKLGQHLTMTPQLQQAIKLLQLSTMELNSEILSAIESNPMLEILEDNDPNIKVGDFNNESFEKYTQLSQHDSYNSQSNAANSLDYLSQLHTKHETLREHLNWQIQMSALSKLDQTIAFSIIDAIDDDGYLTEELEIIQKTLQATDEISLKDIEVVLHYINQCDPIGVGARNLHECLLIQLINKSTADKSPTCKIALDIVKNNFNLLAAKNYNQILRNLKLSPQELQKAITIIQNLNPRPGALITPIHAEYIYPDVLVRKIKGKWVIELNQESLPQVKINSHYSSLVKRSDNSSDNLYMRGQLQEAKWLIKSVLSRNETLLKVAKCIVEYQHGFFELGEEAMRPLVLSDIAQQVGMHESTISRVTSRKFMHTPKGIFELKYFFSSHLDTVSGGECSSTAIRALIKKLIAEENQQKPLSDNKISLILKNQGINVARRTIAKYRESMNIPSSNIRKKL